MRNIIPYKNKAPEINESSYINLHSLIIGNVKINENCSVWPGAILCAFEQEILINNNVVILDKAVLTATDENQLEIGEGVLISQSSVLQGCRVGRNVLIGKGANVCNGATIGEGAIINPGTIILPGQSIPPHSLALEIPAKVSRKITEEEQQKVREHHAKLSTKAKEYGSFYNLSLD